jgi:hypothetical protein
MIPRLDPPTRPAARIVRDPIRHRRRRHGRSLQGTRHSSRPSRRDQSPVSRVCIRSAIQSTVRSRGARHLAARAPVHLRVIRRRRAGRHGVSRDAASRGRDTDPPARARRVAASRRADDRGRDRRRAGQGASVRHRPSRSETRQRDADEVGREAARFRPREDWCRHGRRRRLQAADDGSEARLRTSRRLRRVFGALRGVQTIPSCFRPDTPSDCRECRPPGARSKH